MLSATKAAVRLLSEEWRSGGRLPAVSGIEESGAKEDGLVR
jgi:hypothetical protein